MCVTLRTRMEGKTDHPSISYTRDYKILCRAAGSVVALLSLYLYTWTWLRAVVETQEGFWEFKTLRENYGIDYFENTVNNAL